MSQLTLLHGARQLLTLRGLHGARRGSALLDLGVIENGAILLKDGRIRCVGPTRRLENLKEVRSATSIDVSGSIVMPGLVDPGVNFTLHAAGNSVRNRRMLAIQERGATLLRSCLQHGTLTAALNVSAEGEGSHADIGLLRQIAKVYGNPVDLVRTWKTALPGSAAAGSTSDWALTLQTLVTRKLLDALAVVASEQPVAPEVYAALHATGLPASLHWSGGATEQLATMLACLRPDTVFSSPMLPDDGTIPLLARSGSTLVVAPGTVVGRPIGPGLRQFVDAGGSLALSSGYHPVHSPGFSMQMAISLAIVQGGMTPEEAISAATVNAAYAAGRGHLTGTLEVGKRADLLVLDVLDYRDIARQFGINHVSTALRDGNVVYNRGRWKIMSNESSAGRVRSQSVGRA